MSEARTEFQRGLAALRAGHHGEALSGFLMALALDPEVPEHRTQALAMLGVTGGYTTLPQLVLDGLARCAEDPHLDLQPLALVVRILLEHNPARAEWLDTATQESEKLESALSQGVFDSLLTDPLMLAVLTHAVNVSLELEDLLTALRRHALECVAERRPTVLLTRHRRFFEALAIQAERTDFAWMETLEERGWLTGVNSKQDGALITSAYERLVEPAPPDVRQLTAIDDAVSRKVQDQYSAYPYPRWERLTSVRPRSLRDMLSARFPGETWPDRFDGPVTGLSAGCGTGRGALMLVQSVKDLTLTAMDLSPNSLAFAQSKAEDLGIGGVTFGLGDILTVADLGQTFDIVESSGVLHHMDDPSAGLKALVGCLAPDGVMRIALYSERARSAVVAARAWIAAEAIPDSKAGLKQARADLRALPADHRAKPVTETPEFFVLSGLHDLIFNVQEHRFTPLGLNNLLHDAGLRFLGFDHTDPAVPARYAVAFPDDPAQTDLDNWEAFEQNHPDTFAEMYQMWCRPEAQHK